MATRPTLVQNAEHGFPSLAYDGVVTPSDTDRGNGSPPEGNHKMTLTTKILPLAALLAVALPGGSAMAAPKAKFRLSTARVAVAEGDTGVNTVTVDVTRAGRGGRKALTSEATVHLAIGGSATNGTDYSASIQSGASNLGADTMLSFASGEVSKRI